MSDPSDEEAGLTPLPYRRKRSAALLVSDRSDAAGMPFSAMVEIADRCNEACVHCYQVQGTKGELDTEQWEKVFSELAELGVMFLTISGGEPTLRKDFLHLVAYARKLRFAVKIFSNALNISPTLAAELGRLSVQEVQISLYSHRAEVHDGVTRVPGSFERVVRATRDLREAGVKVVLKSPLMTLNAAEYAEYVAFVIGLGADYTLDPKLNPRENGDMAPTALALGKPAYLALRRDIRFASPPPRAERRLDAAPCSACRGNVHVEPNGEMRPCTQWNIPTGQATDGGVREAWYGNAAARAIRGLTWNDLPGCRECDLRAFCQRCFADAERYAGDALAPYAQACGSALWKYQAERGVQPEIDSEAGYCAALPVGPFRNAGEHRFMVAPTDPLSPPALERPWLGAAPNPEPAVLPRGFVPLRRGATGPALRVAAAAPSAREL
jgi:radical SAM protein with 4Fe4S-binding SPASM domain